MSSYTDSDSDKKHKDEDRKLTKTPMKRIKFKNDITDIKKLL